MRERMIGRTSMRGSDGETYTVLVFEELKAVPTKSGTDYIPGMRRLELEDGREVINMRGVNTIRGSSITLSDA